MGKPDMCCALVAQHTCESKRALGMKNTVFTHSVSILKRLCFAYLNIFPTGFHLLQSFKGTDTSGTFKDHKPTSTFKALKLNS